jgi:RNA polymerase-binding transcription factor DksA
MTAGILPAAEVADGTAGIPAAGTLPARTSHGWRTLLESRWGERLINVITLSLAYHDTAERRPADRRLRRLMRKTVAARRELSDTEDALARLADGRFGTCEQCAAPIPASVLAQVPETRYCGHCA